MIIGKTQNVCPVCLSRIPAQKVVGEDGNIYMEKRCFEHGAFRTLIWEGDPESYRAWAAGDVGGKVTPVRAVEVEKGCPYDCGLCQSHERDGCCVLLELTNRCNLRCPVCFASAGEQKPRDLSLEEIGRQYDLLMERGGPFNIQLSGGKPTMRDDLPEIIALGRSKGFTFFQLNTNGIRLAKEEGYARNMTEAGVGVAFLQFDGLDDEIYRTLRGCGLLETKLQAIENCREAGLPVVLVPTLAPGVNDHALGQLLEFALARAPHIRGVHIQPISYFGRCSQDAPPMRLTIPKVLRLIEEQTNGKIKAADFGGGGAVTCPAFQGMHLRENHILAEIIDETGRPLPDGQWGELVITTIGQEAMPLIRYRTGDRARFFAGTCLCGGVTTAAGPGLPGISRRTGHGIAGQPDVPCPGSC